MIARRGMSAICRCALAATASSSAASGVTRIACASSSCSACEKRSIATQSGLRARVGDHQDLRGAGDHVDADGAEHAALGRGDVRVAGAADLVDGRASSPCRRRARRSPARRRSRTRASRRRDARPRAPADCARRPGVGTTMTISAHAGDVRRNHVHQHRRRIRRLAAGHVDADAVERRHLLAELAAVGLRDTTTTSIFCRS